MESVENTTASSTSSLSSSPSRTSPKAVAVISPCAACKILRRKCGENCVLAPYFPPSEPLKFTTAHRVFGASNIIKFLQKLPESQRADAVSSMVYEANTRIRDPVYGCTRVICHLQEQVNQLQVQLARTQAELLSTQCQNAQITRDYLDIARSSQQSLARGQYSDSSSSDDMLLMDGRFLDENSACTSWPQILWP